METSTYGSELVAERIAIEVILELRYQLRMLGVPIDGSALLLGDSTSMVLNTTVPSSVLKKKHNAIAYHRVREAIAAGDVHFCHIRSELNIADCITKALGNQPFHSLIKPVLFLVPVIAARILTNDTC